MFLCIGQNSKYLSEISSAETKGIQLFYSEKSSWEGTDIMLRDYKHLLPLSGGYFTIVEKQSTTFILFSKDEKPVSLLKIKFDLKPTFKVSVIDTAKSKLTKSELKYFEIRKLAFNRFYQGLINNYIDSTFIVPRNSKPNFIPIVDGKNKYVYILSASSTGKKCFFGGDYKLTFDNNNKNISIKKLHLEITSYPLYDTSFVPKQKTINHFHDEEDGDFITETDICTALLYKDIVGYNYYTVSSKKLAILLDCNDLMLTVIER